MEYEEASKICSVCGVSKSFEDFHNSKQRADNKYPYCKSCGKIAAADRRRKKRLKFHEYKTSKGCELCGYNENPVALQFDHINPKEKCYSIANMVSEMRPDWMIWEEIKKCRVICANCHMVETYG